MLENIRQIGIFMIIAQTVMHFAAGKQYEKYMKIISGVIVLLLFIRPFVSDSDNIAARWQEKAAGLMEEIEERSKTGYRMSYAADSTQTAVIQQIEEEIKSRINDSIADRGEQVVEVTINLERNVEAPGMGSGAGVEEPVFECVRVTVQKTDTKQENQLEEEIGSNSAEEENMSAAEEKGRIRIEEIVVGDDEEKRQKNGSDGTGADIQVIKRIIAQTLGITEERVEVVYVGG